MVRDRAQVATRLVWYNGIDHTREDKSDREGPNCDPTYNTFGLYEADYDPRPARDVFAGLAPVQVR
jgi:hypothetical protein